MGESDTRSRKWQLTINNPTEHNLEHNTIKEYLSNLDNLIYWCMCDEIGGKEKTYHTHVYIHLKNAIRFSTLKSMFTTAHIEKANGTAIQNKDYILKQGKYADTEKESTNLKDTFEEMGIVPEESQGKRTDLIEIFEMAKDGIKTVDILSEYPSALLYIDKIEKVRTEIQREKFKNTFRKLDVTYIYGKTGAGKTRYVMDSFGYENVYRVTDYKNMFDSYSMQDVIIFEEFRSSVHVKDMLSYLDGYPIDLPCRYSNKVACFTKVFIISNIDLLAQYTDIQRKEVETYRAFLRRINKIIYFDYSQKEEFESVNSYLESRGVKI